VTWTIGNLNGSPIVSPGESTTLTLAVEVGDVAQRPFRNVAEISADSADDYDAPFTDVKDADSVPDDLIGNDGTYPALAEFPVPGAGIDNLVIAEAGSDGAGDEDDADIADVGVVVTYDLQLIKTVADEVITPGGGATFTLSVLNQGDVPKPGRRAQTRATCPNQGDVPKPGRRAQTRATCPVARSR
jgi:hypothetical protein